MAKSPLHAALYGALVLVLAACSLIAGGDNTNSVEEPAPPVIQTAATGDGCGGIAGIACGDEGDYCHFEPSDMCGAADAMGTCRTVPEVCTREFRPVCGCDGETYPNPCVAHSTGVSVSTMGPCEPA